MSTESSLIRTSKNLKNILFFFLALVVLNLAWTVGSNIIANMAENNIIQDYSPYKLSDDAFGEIALSTIDPKLAIGEQSTSYFSLSGNFKNFPDKFNVYKVTKPKETFLTVTKAQQTAQKLGFKTEVGNPNDNILTWETENRSLFMNKDGLLWSLTSEEGFLSQLLEKIGNEQELETAIKEAWEAVSNLQLPLTENINFINPLHYFIKLDPLSARGFTRVEEGESNYILLSFDEYLDALPLKNTGRADEQIAEQKIKKKAKMYSSDPYLSKLYVILNKNFVREESILSMIYLPVRYGEVGIYNVVTPKEAFTKLQEGKGILRAIKSSIDDTFDSHDATLNINEFVVVAEETDLAYFVYDIVEGESYTYPIYIFNGNAKLDGGEIAEFTFYVDALDFN